MTRLIQLVLFPDTSRMTVELAQPTQVVKKGLCEQLTGTGIYKESI